MKSFLPSTSWALPLGEVSLCPARSVSSTVCILRSRRPYSRQQVAVEFFSIFPHPLTAQWAECVLAPPSTAAFPGISPQGQTGSLDPEPRWSLPRLGTATLVRAAPHWCQALLHNPRSFARLGGKQPTLAPTSAGLLLHFDILA